MNEHYVCGISVSLSLYILTDSSAALQPAHVALVRDSNVMVKPNLESRESSM